MGVDMWIRQTVFRAVCCLSVAVGAASWSAAGSAPLDKTAIRAKLAPCLCRVTVQNTWGIPLALANGFVLGNGRFVVTELGALARHGAARAVVRFRDGSKVATDQFGMADPVSGLAALYLKPGASSREGLTLVLTLPPLDANPMVATTDSGGSQLELAVGRLVAGPKMHELASRTGVSGLKADWTFLRILGRGVVGASGVPVLDGEGAVVGVRMDVLSGKVTAPLVVPATALRDALFSSKPELKRLAELPKAAWAVPILRLEGQPVTASQFSRLARGLKDGMVCRQCNGKGSIVKRSVYSSYGLSSVRCGACGGDGIVCPEDVYARMAQMAEECARVAWAPDIEARTRKAVLAEGLQRLKALAAAGPRFLRDWGRAVAADLQAADGDFPRGIVLYARVGETIEGPDGRYTLLEMARARVSAAFRPAAVTNPSTPGPAGVPAEPRERTWIVIGGVAQARIGSGKAGSPLGHGKGRPVYVLPFGWVPAHAAAASGR